MPEQSSEYIASYVPNHIESTIKKVLNTIGMIIFLGGFIGGIIVGFRVPRILALLNSYNDKKFEFGLALICWGSSFISGMIFVGLGEIILYLEDLINMGKIYKIYPYVKPSNTSDKGASNEKANLGSIKPIFHKLPDDK